MHRALATLLLLTAAASAAAADAPVDPGGDFSPMLALMALLAILVMLVMLGICLAVAVIAALCIVALIALGILSTSALTGILRRKFSSGLRAFHYQICAAIALFAGAGLAWLIARIMDRMENLPAVLAIGSLAGICAGLAIAFALDRAVSTVIGWFRKRGAARNLVGQGSRDASP